MSGQRSTLINLLTNRADEFVNLISFPTGGGGKEKEEAVVGRFLECDLS